MPHPPRSTLFPYTTLFRSLAVLPALQKPTISALSDSEWVAVNTIIEEGTAWKIMPQLKAARAEGIVEYPLNKRSEEHTSELQSHSDLVCRLLLEKKKINTK